MTKRKYVLSLILAAVAVIASLVYTIYFADTSVKNWQTGVISLMDIAVFFVGARYLVRQAIQHFFPQQFDGC